MKNNLTNPSTCSRINYNLKNKEYILQKQYHPYGNYRCISWHPHYITTEWYKSKEIAVFEAEKKIRDYYKNDQRN